MNANPRIPHTAPRRHVPAAERVMTLRQLREQGVPAAVVARRCRAGGPWRQLLPQVYLLHSGAPTSRERLQAALLYAGRDPRAGDPQAHGTQAHDPEAQGTLDRGREAMVTGLAALALHRFRCVPPLAGLTRIDVLVPRQRRLRDAGEVTVHRATAALPHPQDVMGVPCAPVPRALADAVAGLDDAESVRRLLTEAVRGGHCDAAAVLGELADAGLLERPQVAAAVGALHGADRAMAEERLYAMVRDHGLPDPVWNVELRLPGGPPLGGVDAYWPEHAVAVAVELPADVADDATWSRTARQRERLDALGITLIHLTPAELREAGEQQAAVVRTALVDAVEHLPAAYIVVLPR